MSYIESVKATDLIQFANQMIDEGLAIAGDLLSTRLPLNEMLVLKIPDDFTTITEALVTSASIESYIDGYLYSELHAGIYKNRPDINAVITNHAPRSTAIAESEKKFPAVLDDVAQIIGPRVYVAKNSQLGSVLKCIKKRGACLIKNSGAVATGRTLDEAHTCALVLEKGAHCYIDSAVLGGAHKIPYLEALLMRFVYKTKYSKADQTAKMQS
jgi:L-fuculose-phosphate aldolase